MCKYCGNTGLCYSFLTMAVIYIYKKIKLFLRKFINLPSRQIVGK